MVEDEEHFLLHCPTYSSHRCNMLVKVAQKFPSVQGLDNSEKFVWLLSQDDNDCIIWVSNFIFSSMKKRKKKLVCFITLLLINDKFNNIVITPYLGNRRIH